MTRTISDGLEPGIVAWVAIKILGGRWKDVSGVMFILAVLFTLKLANVF